MKALYKFVAIGLATLTLAGCAGTVMNTEKNCSYQYLLHPAISVSRVIGGCGPAAKS